jgi:hypothetical protein
MATLDRMGLRHNGGSSLRGLAPEAGNGGDCCVRILACPTLCSPSYSSGWQVP